MLIRQLVLFGGFILVLALLIFVIDGCRDSARESALKDYNRDVATLVRDSDTQVGKPFFDLLRNPSQGDLSTAIAGYRSQAEAQYQQAKRISTPDDMTSAQRSFLIAMEMRRDGLSRSPTSSAPRSARTPRSRTRRSRRSPARCGCSSAPTRSTRRAYTR